MTTKIRVAAIIFSDDKILTTEMEKNGETYHVFPGGRVEENETTEDALKRELSEETNLELEKFSLAYIRELKMKKERGIEFYYKVEEYTGTPETGYDPEEKESELKKVHHKSLTELEKLNFFPKQLIDRIKKDRKNSFPRVKHLGLHDYP